MEYTACNICRIMQPGMHVDVQIRPDLWDTRCSTMLLIKQRHQVTTGLWSSAKMIVLQAKLAGISSYRDYEESWHGPGR